MADWSQCPHCGLKHSARPDGLCPRCRSPIASAATAAAAPRVAPGAMPPSVRSAAPAAGAAPHVLGVFMARQANTWTWDVMYDVHVAQDRLVCARTGGQFAAEGGTAQVVALGVLFGAMGGLIAALIPRGPSKAIQKARQETAHLSLDALATAHKKNFQLFFRELERAEVRPVRVSFHGPAAAKLVYQRRGDGPKELLLPDADAARTCVTALQQALGPKVKVDPALRV